MLGQNINHWRVVVAIGVTPMVAPGSGITLRDDVAIVPPGPDGVVLSSEITRQSAGAGSTLQVVGACLIQGRHHIYIPHVEEVASPLSRFMHHDGILVHRMIIAIGLADRVVSPCNTEICVRL